MGMLMFVEPFSSASCFRCFRSITLTPPGASEPGSSPGIMRWLPQDNAARGDCQGRPGEHCTPYPPE